VNLMKTPIARPIVALAILTFLGTALAAPVPEALTVHATGFQNGKGHAIVNLFSEGQDVMKMQAAFRRSSSSIENGRATFTFVGLPPGYYAISVFHDLNDNGELDHKMGIPAEPLGFSNGFRLSLFSVPSFEKLKFLFDGKSKSLEIRLR
jgi:uncharacterized protein (DUF2141 family)